MPPVERGSILWSDSVSALCFFQNLARLCTVVTECVSAFCVDFWLQTNLFQSGVLWHLLPNLFKYDFTLDEGGVEKSQESNQQVRVLSMFWVWHSVCIKMSECWHWLGQEKCCSRICSCIPSWVRFCVCSCFPAYNRDTSMKDHPFFKTTFPETVPCKWPPQQGPLLFQDQFSWSFRVVLQEGVHSTWMHMSAVFHSSHTAACQYQEFDLDTSPRLLLLNLILRSREHKYCSK